MENDILKADLENIKFKLENTEFEEENNDYFFEDKNYVNTHVIASKVGYLIGVEKRFYKETNDLDLNIFEELEEDKSAVIIRNLCRLRTVLMSKNKYIREEIKYNYKTIDTIPEIIPQEIFRNLSKQGISVVKNSKQSVHKYIIDVNAEINNRINNCKHIFPIWVVWDYIKNLFIMPGGLSNKGVYDELGSKYFIKKSMYPYTCYINWNPKDIGNMLESDRKFLTELYAQNGSKFKDFNCVTQLGESTREDILDFIENSGSLDIIVDCENANPYRLAIALNQLSEEVHNHIEKLILIDDVNTPKVWGYFNTLVPKYTIERIEMERINEKKSLVDIGLTAKLCKEFYENNINSFIICSSDSDFWGLIKALPDAKYMVMVEHERVGIDLKKALSDAGILYVYTEEFYEGEDEELGLKNRVIFQELKSGIEEKLNFNLYNMLSDILREIFIGLGEEEKDQVVRGFIDTMEINMKKDGSIVLERK